MVITGRGLEFRRSWLKGYKRIGNLRKMMREDGDPMKGYSEGRWVMNEKNI